MAATTVTFCLLDLLFYEASLPALPLKQPRMGYAFMLPSEHTLMVLVCFLTGVLIAHTKKWGVPLLLGLFLYSLYVPTLGGSYPVDLFGGAMALFGLNIQLLGMSVIITTLIVAIWIKRGIKPGSRSQES